MAWRDCGEQDLADFTILVGPARRAEQRAVFLAVTEFLGAGKASLPQSPAIGLRSGLVFPEPGAGGGSEVQGQALTDKQLVQARGFTLDGADAAMPSPVVLVRAAIVASNRAFADQLYQLITDVDAAAPGIGMVVDADLVQLRCIDSVEP